MRNMAKKVTVAVGFLLASVCAQALEMDKCFLLTTEPSKFTNLDKYGLVAYHLSQSITRVRIKQGTGSNQVVSFTEAYREFTDFVYSSLSRQCANDKSIVGAVNLRMTHSVDDHAYHFGATSDIVLRK